VIGCAARNATSSWSRRYAQAPACLQSGAAGIMTRGRRRDARRVWVYACLMLLAGNGKVITGSKSLAGDLRGVLIGLLVATTSLVSARRMARLTWDEVGLAPRRRIPASLGVGVALVSVLTLLAATIARGLRAAGIPLEPPGPPGDLAELSAEALRRRLLLYLPFDTALPEELVFRSVLLAELRPRFRGLLLPVVLSTAAFLVWHAALGWSEVPDHQPRKLLQKYGFYALGSLVFTLPHLATGHVAGSMATHWLADGLLLLAGHTSGRRLKTFVFPE
jgi:membrane protease YdiL (CAAX protease family)